MITPSHIVPLFIVIPLTGAFLVSLFSRWIKKVPDLFGFMTTLSLLIVSLVTIVLVQQHHVLVYSVGAWKPPVGIAMVVDGLSAFMLFTVNFVAFLISVYSISYMERFTAKWKFYTLFLLTLGGMNGVLITGDIFNLYVLLEITSLASFALVAFGTERHELEAAFKYAVMSTVGALFILLGIVLLYSFTSTLNMADIAASLVQKGKSHVVLMVSVLFIMGFGLKAALVPFHGWLPDAHPSAPAPISAMLSGVLIKSLGVYTLCRIFFNVIGITPVVSSILMFLGVFSMLVGGLMAIGQWDMKRLLAYSTISQVGYIIFGIGLGTPLGILGALFHLFNHSIMKSLLFLDAGAVEYSTGTRELQKLGGLMSKLPVTGSTNLIGAMSISGIPPFNGFWSKLIIILAAVEAGKLWYAFWAVVASVLTLAALMKVMKYAFFGALREQWSHLKEVPFLMRFSMVTLACVCVVGGIFLIPGISGVFLQPAADSVLEGLKYAVIVVTNIP